MTSRMIAIDWSGARQAAGQKIWLAEARPGDRHGDRPGLRRLEDGRDRAAIAEHLIEEAGKGAGLIVGFDFAFSLPDWFLEDRGLRSAPELWELVEREGEHWLAGCAPPFWGRPGKRRPDLPEHFRRTDQAVPAVGSIRPKSGFQIGGAGAVGTGSLRGMSILKRLRDAGFTIWPFDAPGRHVVVEIYPRALTGAVNKSDPAARDAYLRCHHPWLDVGLRLRAASTEDAFDAAVSALVMARHHRALSSLPSTADEMDRREGRIWLPPELPPDDESEDGAPTIWLVPSGDPEDGAHSGRAPAPAEVPGADPDRWQELVRTMLPAPVWLDATGALVGGEPGEVVVRIYSDAIEVSTYGIRWDSHRPVDDHERVALYRLGRAGVAQVSRAIARARARRLRTYRWCAWCREVQPPEWMHRESTCQGCAERYLGVIH